MFAFEHAEQMSGQLGLGQTLEDEMLAATDDGLGNFSGSVVAMMKVKMPRRFFKGLQESALKAALDSMCASSMMMTL